MASGIKPCKALNGGGIGSENEKKIEENREKWQHQWQ